MSNIVISMFDKSSLQKKLCYFGEDDAPHLRVRNAKLRISTYLHKDDAWMYDEPDKNRDELRQLEMYFDRLRLIAAVSPEDIFDPDLWDSCGEIAFKVALTQFRRAIVLGVDTSNSSLHKLREFICDGPDGLDDLLDMPPYDRVKKAVGEYEALVDGTKITGDMIV